MTIRKLQSCAWRRRRPMRSKYSAYVLGKEPENLTEKQQLRVEMFAENNNRLYRAYRMKEMLRLLLKIKDIDEAEATLKRWLWWSSHSRIPLRSRNYTKRSSAIENTS